MFKKKITIIFFSFTTFLILIFFIKNFFLEKIEVSENNQTTEVAEELIHNTNIIEDVNYVTNDKDGNHYIVTALKGEIDYSDPNVIYLTNVNAIIKLNDSSKINITSDYGKYNSENFDTIFSKNVIINYLENRITGEYLDFSLERNSMIVSKNVIYTNLENILRADVIEVNIKTKDTKIFMYEQEKKVNIKSKN